MSKEQAWSELNRTGLIFNIFVNGLLECLANVFWDNRQGSLKKGWGVWKSQRNVAGMRGDAIIDSCQRGIYLRIISKSLRFRFLEAVVWLFLYKRVSSVTGWRLFFREPYFFSERKIFPARRLQVWAVLHFCRFLLHNPSNFRNCRQLCDREQ